MTDLQVKNTKDTQGTFLHLQRLSTEDGPGIRTTVFFKGCPLNCRWCHNPESISPRQQMQWHQNRCIGCSSCIEACPQGCLSRAADGGSMLRDHSRCTACGLCAEACPAGAMELLGTRISARELAQELMKDRAYFEKSDGGVTLSGGEPTMQPDFCRSLLEQIREGGIHTALDTCGLCSPSVLEGLLIQVDVVLFDVKIFDPDAHKSWCGVSNERILENLLLIKRVIQHRNAQTELWVRTPLIPEATATQDNILRIGAFLAEKLGSGLQRWELCAFNNLCLDKYARLGLTWDFASQPLLSQQELDVYGGWANRSGVDPHKIFVTGSARLESQPSGG